MARYVEVVNSAEIISEKLNIPLADLVDVFAEIPTADVVEVVRCKDCKYGEIDDADFPDQYLCHHSGENWNNVNHFCGYGTPKERGVVSTLHLLAKMPTADVVEVQHGEWLNIIFTQRYRCSLCGNEIYFGKDKFCSECGAKMDGTPKERGEVK